MSAEYPCPHCGRPVPRGAGSWRPEDDARVEQAAAEAAEVSSLSLLGSGSNDDTFAASPFGHRDSAGPDPILGRYPAETPAPALPGTRDLFPSIDFSAPATSTAGGRPRPTSGSIDDEAAPPRPSTSWPLVLVGSYASALTLALAWTLLGQKVRDRPTARPPAAAVEEDRVDPGLQAGRSRRVEPPGPISPDRVVAMGKPLRVGSLEVTPIEVRRQDVSLQRTNLEGKIQRRDGGKGAFVLNLRLRNTSADTVFAPLDQAFVRERSTGVVDTFIEAADGGKIYPYPLAVESEWSIAGQDFAELRPGESRVVAVASVPDAPVDDRGTLTWRVRLRTGIDRTDVIGVPWQDAAGSSKAKR